MITDEMVEAAAKEFERHAWPHAPWDSIHESGRERYRAAARDGLNAAESIRIADQRKNCKHYNRIGNGSAGSDGSSSYGLETVDRGSRGTVIMIVIRAAVLARVLHFEQLSDVSLGFWLRYLSLHCGWQNRAFPNGVDWKNLEPQPIQDRSGPTSPA